MIFRKHIFRILLVVMTISLTQGLGKHETFNSKEKPK